MRQSRLNQLYPLESAMLCPSVPAVHGRRQSPAPAYFLTAGLTLRVFRRPSEVAGLRLPGEPVRNGAPLQQLCLVKNERKS